MNSRAVAEPRQPTEHASTRHAPRRTNPLLGIPPPPDPARASAVACRSRPPDAVTGRGILIGGCSSGQPVRELEPLLGGQPAVGGLRLLEVRHWPRPCQRGQRPVTCPVTCGTASQSANWRGLL